MKIHDFKKGMDKTFGDRHINIGGIPTPPIHTIGLVRYVQTTCQLLTMDLETYKYTKKDLLKLLFNNWWISGEIKCKFFIKDNTCDTAQEAVEHYEKTNKLWLPNKHKDKPNIEKLCFKWAIMTTLAIFEGSKEYKKTKAGDKLNAKLLIDLSNTARNYGN